MQKSLLKYFVLSLQVFLFVILFHSEGQAQGKCRDLFEERSSFSDSVLNFERFVENYSKEIPAVKKMIAIGQARFGRSEPKGYCYRAVKQLLLDSGLVKRAIDGTFASSAHTKNFLVNRGFVNILERAPFNKRIQGALDENIPEGAILVYAGRNGVDGGLRELNQGVGHIEIKCGPSCYLFDTVALYPGGRNQFLIPNTFEAGVGVDQRRLIGVYVLDYFSLF